MRELFVVRNFTKDSLRMIGIVDTIMAEYEAMGFDLTLRQLYYQLVQKNVIPNNQKSYNNLGSLVSDARLAGMLDWAIIKDRGRETQSVPHWESPADIVDQAAAQFKVDRWADQPNYVLCMVEKQALEGVLIPTCRSLDIPFAANKGYSSSSTFYETGQRLRAHAEGGQSLHIIYLGDHDPSGMDMTRDVIERMQLFSRNDVHVHRVALNMDQVRAMALPENFAKQTDARYKGYEAEFGDKSWELDAIEPRTLAGLVEGAVTPLLDQKKWKASGERQQALKDELLAMAKKYRAKLDRLNGVKKPRKPRVKKAKKATKKPRRKAARPKKA